MILKIVNCRREKIYNQERKSLQEFTFEYYLCLYFVTWWPEVFIYPNHIKLPHEMWSYRHRVFFPIESNFRTLNRQESSSPPHSHTAGPAGEGKFNRAHSESWIFLFLFICRKVIFLKKINSRKVNYFLMFDSVMKNKLKNTFQCLVMSWKWVRK
jgi:hypothetical protein